MARKNYYSRKKPFFARRLALGIALVLVIAAAIAKLSSIGNSQQEFDSDKPVATKTQTPVNNNIELTSVANISRPAKNTNPPIMPTDDNAPDLAATAKTQLGQNLLAAGDNALTAKDYITAREKFSKAVAQGLPTTQDARARKLLNHLSDTWLFSRNLFDNDPLCSLYKVAPGEILSKIGKKFSVPHQLLMRINNISKPEKLQAGQTIKVVQGPFHVVVDRSRFLMSVYLGDVMVRSYPVCIGKPGRNTPTGLWQVKNNTKLIKPEWTDPDTHKKYYPDDPDNPLGERWIGLEGLEGDALGRSSFGIHGTIEPKTLGSAASRGCIRMLNSDVIELFNLLAETKSQVTVIN